MSRACASPLRELLPWHLNGSLEGSEAAGVQAHLAACDACARELRELGHIAELVRLEDAPIDRPAREAAPAVTVRFPAPVGRRSGAGRRVALVAAVAAVIALAFAGFLRLRSHPADRQFTEAVPPAPGADGRPGTGADPSGGPVADAPTTPVVLARLDLGAGPIRGATAVPVLHLPAGAEQVEVTFIVPGGGVSATVRIEDEARRPIAQPLPLAGHDDLGRSAARFPAGALRAGGSFALVLSQEEPSDDPSDGPAPRVEYRYPFLCYLQSPAATNAPQ